MMHKFVKWRYVLPVGIAAIAALLVIVGVVVSDRAFERQVVRAFQLYHLTIARSIATTAQEMVADICDHMQYLAGDSDIVKEADHVQTKLDLFLEQHSDVLNNVAIVDANGDLIYESPKSNEKRNISGSAGFQAVCRTGKPCIGKLEQCTRHNSRQAVRVIAPILDQGQIKGVIYVCLNLGELWARCIPSAAKGHQDICWVVTNDGRLLYHTNSKYLGLTWDQIEDQWRASAQKAGKDIDEQIENLERRLRKRVQDGEQGTAEYVNALTGTEELLAFTPIRLKNERYGLAVAAPKSEICGPIDAHMRIMFAVIAAMLVLLAVAAYIAVGGIRSHVQLLAEKRNAAQRQQGQQALEESENRYRALFESSPEGILMAETQTRRFRYANPAICKMLGYSRAELEGMAVDTIHPKNDLPRVIAEFQAQARGDISLATDIPMLRKDGTVFCADINSAFIVLDGKMRVLGFFRDTSERKQAEQALRESEEKYRAIFEQAADTIVLIDAQTGTLLEFNSKAHQNLGYSRKEFQRLKIADVEVIESAEEVMEHTTRVVREGSDTFETKQRTKDGRIRDILVTAKPISIGGRVLCLSTWRDVTEQKKLEEAVRESEQTFRLFMETAFDGIDICEYDPKTGKRRLIFCNDRYVEMSGYTREQLMSAENLNELTLAHASTEEKSHWGGCMANGTPSTGMSSWKRPDGKENTYEWSAIYIKKGQKYQIFGVDRDVTERRRAEEDIRQYQKRLQSLAVDLSLAEDQERRRLASELHDGPGQLLSLAKIKLSTLDKLILPAEGKESLAAIEQLVEQAELSTRSLTFEIYNPALHDLGFESAVEWLAENIQKSYGLKVDLADDGQHNPMDEPLRVVMFQCLREVLVNAAKYAKVDRARVDIARHRQFVRVTIKDDGVGFDPQASFTENRGFGLFSIRERITRLGGYVKIKSAPGQGTTVILEGPISTDKHKTTRKKP